MSSAWSDRMLGTDWLTSRWGAQANGVWGSHKLFLHHKGAFVSSLQVPSWFPCTRKSYPEPVTAIPGPRVFSNCCQKLQLCTSSPERIKSYCGVVFCCCGSPDPAQIKGIGYTLLQKPSERVFFQSVWSRTHKWAQSLRLFTLTMCSRVLLSLRDPTMPTTDTVNITRPSRMSTTAGARKSPSRVRFFCRSTSAYTPTHSTHRPTS